MPVPTGSRGLLTLADVGLWCEDPFRLWARRITVAPPAHVIVYPTPIEVSEDGRTTGAHAGNRAPMSAAGSVGALSGDELSGLRPYTPGDRLTRLHWPSLARTGELVVREFLEPQAGSLSLLVDLRPSAHTAASVEETISRAAGLGARALRQGLTLELCTSTGDRVVIPPNARGRQTMLRALALLGPANAPAAVVRRWGDRPTGGAVWATVERAGRRRRSRHHRHGGGPTHAARVPPPGRDGPRPVSRAAPGGSTAPSIPSDPVPAIAPDIWLVGGVPGGGTGDGAPDPGPGGGARRGPDHRHGTGRPPGDVGGEAPARLGGGGRGGRGGGRGPRHDLGRAAVGHALRLPHARHVAEARVGVRRGRNRDPLAPHARARHARGRAVHRHGRRPGRRLGPGPVGVAGGTGVGHARRRWCRPSACSATRPC